MNIIIDQQWLDENQEEWGGWRLGEEGATYILETDVAAPRTAFAIGADNITLDIQDKIVKFGCEAEIRVPNFDFENRIRGWRDINGEDPIWHTNCEYIKQECQTGDSAITIPEVEAGKEYRIRTQQSFELKAGNYYALNHWDIRRPANTKLPKCQVRVQIGDLDPAVGPKRDKPGTTNYSIFTPSEDMVGRISFFITVPEDAEEAGFYRMDNVLLSHSRCHGITGRGSSNHWNNKAPDLPIDTDYKRALYGFTLKSSAGSKIVQGGAGFGGCCINLRSSKQCNITGPVYLATHPRSVNEHMGKCMQAMYATDLTISPEVKTNNQAIANCNRQQHWGFNTQAKVMQGNCSIGINSISSNQGAASVGLKKDSDGTLIVTGNGKAETRFTNGFFLMVQEGGPDSSIIVEDITVRNGGKHGGRGIHWQGYGTESYGVNTIRNCKITTQELALNQEYGVNNNGYTLGGCYGIQVEKIAHNLVIDNNVISVRGLSESSAYRLSTHKDQIYTLSCTATNNTFEAMHSDVANIKEHIGGKRAAVFKPYGINGDALGPQKGNKFVFNDCLINFEGYNTGTILFEDTTIEYVNEGSPNESAYHLSYKGGGSVEFRNTTFVGPDTLEKLTKKVDITPNLNHIGSDITVKFTNVYGEPIYMLHIDAETKVTTHTYYDLSGNPHYTWNKQ